MPNRQQKSMLRLKRVALLSFYLAFLPSSSVRALSCTPLVATATEVENLAYPQGLLWRIQSQAANANFVFGTIHLSDPRVTKLSAQVDEAIRQSDRVGTEVDLNQSALQQMAQAMYFHDGTRLDEVISPSLFSQTVTLLSQYGVGEATARRLRPWAAYTSLSLPPTQTSLPLDVVLVAKAREWNKRSFGLETIDEQIDVFESLNSQEQIELLTEAVCHYSTLQAEIEEMLQAYLIHDLASLVSLSQRYRSELKDKFSDVLLRQRNERLAQRMRSEFDQGGAFIAIGALHLPGADGVLSLLANMGYSITRVE